MSSHSDQSPDQSRPSETRQTDRLADRAPVHSDVENAEAPSGGRFKVDLSLSQLIGGGLAAATAAAVGSKLGLAGTIGGAALVSVLTAVAGSIYTASVRRTRAGVQRAIRTRPPRATSPGRATLVDHATGRPTTIGDGEASRQPVTSRASWPRVVLAGAAVFALATLVVLGFEQVTGRALDGEQNSTTVAQVAHEHPKSGSPSDSSSGGQSGRSDGSSSPSASSRSGSGQADPEQDPSSSASEPSGQASGQSEAQPSTGESGGSTPGSGETSSGDSSSDPDSDAGGSSGRSEQGSGQSSSSGSDSGSAGNSDGSSQNGSSQNGGG